MLTTLNNPIVIAISILTYNHEKFIGKNIESIVSQTTDYRFKLFITDDNSTDKTAVICEQYKNKYPDLIDFESFKENIGVIPNWMKNYQKCISSGAEYIANCDGDDYWTDQLRLQKQVDFLTQNPDYGLTFSDTKLVDFNNSELELTTYFSERKKLYKSGYIFWDLLKNNFINTSTICLRTKCIKTIYPQKPEDEERKWFIYDYWLWLHISMNHKVHFFSEVFAHYRTHQENVTTNNSGFFAKRPPYVILDVVSAINKKNVNNIEKRDLISKRLMAILLVRKPNFKTILRTLWLLLRYPPSRNTINQTLQKRLKKVPSVHE